MESFAAEELVQTSVATNGEVEEPMVEATVHLGDVCTGRLHLFKCIPMTLNPTLLVMKSYQI